MYRLFLTIVELLYIQPSLAFSYFNCFRLIIAFIDYFRRDEYFFGMSCMQIFMQNVMYLDDSKEVVMPEIVDDIYKLKLDNRIK